MQAVWQQIKRTRPTKDHLLFACSAFHLAAKSIYLIVAVDPFTDIKAGVSRLPSLTSDSPETLQDFIPDLDD